MFDRKNLLSYLTALVALGLFCTPAYSYYFDSIDKVKFQGYRGEGSFVENPAYAGDCFGYVLLGMPLAAIISEPVRIANYNETSDNIGVAVLKCTTKPMGLFFGGFPYLLKKAFWDFPIWIGGWDISEPSPYDYKPTPVADVEVPPQLIEQPRVKLNEESATPAMPDITPISEPIIVTPSKVELTPIADHAYTETSKVPQIQQVPGEHPIQMPKVDIPATLPVSATGDVSPKSSSQGWEAPQVPEWLTKDLSQ